MGIIVTLPEYVLPANIKVRSHIIGQTHLFRVNFLSHVGKAQGVPLGCWLRLKSQRNMRDSALFKMILSPLVQILLRHLRLLVVQDFLGSIRLLSSFISNTFRVFKPKAEVMFPELCSNVGVLRASNALAHDSLLFSLVRAKLVVAPHPDVLLPLSLIVDLTSLPKLVHAWGVTFRVLEEHLIGRLEVIMA